MEKNDQHISNISTMFYQVLDDVFDNLYEKYGFEQDIIDLKQILIEEYENMKNNGVNMNKCESQYFQIDENGCIKSC